MDSDHGHGSVQGIHGQGEKSKQAEAEEAPAQKQESSPDAPQDNLSRSINKMVGDKKGIEIKVNVGTVKILEGHKPGLYVPKNTTSSGVTLASGLDLSRHSRADLIKMGITDKAILDKMEPYLYKNGKPGPTGDKARELLREQQRNGILDEKMRWKGWDDQLLDDIDKRLIPAKMSAGIDAYNKEAEKYPGTKKFHEWPSEIQTIIVSRFHQRQKNWNMGPDLKTPTEFSQVLMGIKVSRHEEGELKGQLKVEKTPIIEDPKQLRLALSDALKRDWANTSNNALENRYIKESRYLAGDPLWNR